MLERNYKGSWGETTHALNLSLPCFAHFGRSVVQNHQVRRPTWVRAVGLALGVNFPLPPKFFPALIFRRFWNPRNPHVILENPLDGVQGAERNMLLGATFFFWEDFVALSDNMLHEIILARIEYLFFQAMYNH